MVHRLRWSDVLYREELIAVRAKLKKGKERYVPMTSELAEEIRRYPAVIGEDRIFPPTRGDKSRRQRLEGSFEDVLTRAQIRNFWLHDLRHTFASWYMMNGGDLYELAKLLGHSNIKMTERYAEAWTRSYHQDRNNGQGALEHDGVEAGRAGSSAGRKVRVAEMYAICTSGLKH